MIGAVRYRVGLYELDIPAMELLQADEVVPMEPQVFEVLAYLVRHHDRVVTRHELLDEVWGHRFVTEATLSSRIMSARRALGDSGAEQHSIRTVRGRGFRVVAKVEEVIPERSGETPATEHGSQADAALDPDAAARAGPTERPPLSGRDSELALLRRLAAESFGGERRLLLVSGEAGVGKTALVERVIEESASPDALVLRCRCMERRGSAEPYIALLEGLAGACGADEGGRLASELAWRAPSWVAQMPWLLALQEVSDVPKLPGVSPDRMLREIVEALEAVSLSSPVALIVEDAHWSGSSTLDVLASLADRSSPARLLLIATARHDARASGGGIRSLHRELGARGRSVEIQLEPISASAVGEHLVVRLGERARGLAAPLAHRSGGNPLFMERIMEWWAGRGLIQATDESWREPDLDELSRGIPDTLRDLIQQQVMGLEEADRKLVEAAAVVGVEASAAASAAAADVPEDAAEDGLARLAREGDMVAERGGEEWPDGTLAGRYGFAHDLYRETIEDGLPPGRRARMHARVADRLEAAFGTDTQARAAELADHLLAARETTRAIPHLRTAVERALSRAAHREALSMVDRGLEAIADHPDAERRDALEQVLLAPRGIALITTRGWGAPETIDTFRRARELSERHGGPNELAAVLYGLAMVHEFRGEYAESAAVLRERLELPGPELRVESLELLACSSFHRGQFDDSVRAAQEGLLDTARCEPSPLLAAFGENAQVGCHLWSARATWFLGKPDTAVEQAEQALLLAQDHSYGLAHAHLQMALVRQIRGEVAQARESASESQRLAEEGGHGYQAAVASVIRGWSAGMESSGAAGMDELVSGIEAHAGTGAVMDRPHYLGLLGEVHLAGNRLEDAESVLRQALGSIDGDRPFFYEAELRRLLASTLRGQDRPEEADLTLFSALEVARRQGALGMELRIAIDRFEVRGDEGAAGARQDLEGVLTRFDEGHATGDYVRARDLLARSD